MCKDKGIPSSFPLWINTNNINMSQHESANELLQAQTLVWNCTSLFAKSMSLKCAVQMGIPDIIHKYGQPMRISQLLTALKVHPAKANCIHRLMSILVHSGIFAHRKVEKNDGQDEEEEEECCYSLTAASQLLLKDGTLSAVPFLSLLLDPIVTTSSHSLSTWLQNDNDSHSTPFETAHGKGIWDFIASDATFKNCFYDLMVTDSVIIVNALTEKCRGVFEGLKSLVDVGGGTGTMAKAIAKAFPSLNYTVLDLPHVVADQQGTENLNFVGGDMFEAIPQANAVLLKWIMHDWDDERCIKILKRCKEAIPSEEGGGKIIIIDVAIDDKGDDKAALETQLCLDMLVMVLYNGKERTMKDWKKLFKAAGFSHYKITPILGLRSLIEAYP